MKYIDEGNIEEWIFEYHEGNLDVLEKKRLLEFLEANPRHQVEFDIWSRAKLFPKEMEVPIGLERVLLKKVPFYQTEVFKFVAYFSTGILFTFGMFYLNRQQRHNDGDGISMGSKVKAVVRHHNFLISNSLDANKERKLGKSDPFKKQNPIFAAQAVESKKCDTCEVIKVSIAEIDIRPKKVNDSIGGIPSLTLPQSANMTQFEENVKIGSQSNGSSNKVTKKKKRKVELLDLRPDKVFVPDNSGF